MSKLKFLIRVLFAKRWFAYCETSESNLYKGDVSWFRWNKLDSSVRADLSDQYQMDRNLNEVNQILKK